MFKFNNFIYNLNNDDNEVKDELIIQPEKDYTPNVSKYCDNLDANIEEEYFDNLEKKAEKELQNNLLYNFTDLNTANGLFNLEKYNALQQEPNDNMPDLHNKLDELFKDTEDTIKKGGDDKQDKQESDDDDGDKQESDDDGDDDGDDKQDKQESDDDDDDKQDKQDKEKKGGDYGEEDGDILNVYINHDTNETKDSGDDKQDKQDKEKKGGDDGEEDGDILSVYINHDTDETKEGGDEINLQECISYKKKLYL
jgi:hypothetical protein